MTTPECPAWILELNRHIFRFYEDEEFIPYAVAKRMLREREERMNNLVVEIVSLRALYKGLRDTSEERVMALEERIGDLQGDIKFLQDDLKHSSI